MKKTFNIIAWMILTILSMGMVLGVSIHPSRQVIALVLWVISAALIGTAVLLDADK